MAPPPSQNLQFFQQFLSKVLSQRGPSALPYSEDVKWLIRQNLVTLIETYPSLQPKTAVFTHSDGRTVNLLQADGTIPMFYQNVTYNIPIVIWLMDTYPRHPPCVYVVPTPEMVIKNPHPHVSPSGLVAIPYLHNWIYPSSNLVDLVRNLSHLFGLDPPLYTRPTGASYNSNHSSSHESNSSSYTPPPPPSSSASTRSRHHAIPPWSYPPPGSPSPFPPYGVGEHTQSRFMQQHQPADDPAEVYRKSAINKLMENLHGDIEAMRKKREAEMEGLFNVQAVLRQRRDDQLSKGLKEMQEEKEGLEQQLQMILMNTDVLEAWLRENEGKKPIANHGSEEEDEVFEPCDALSKQMLECTSSDLAIEDVIFSLDKAVQEGSIPYDQYLKNIRSLSRQQFFHRATSSKVRAAQMQAQVSSMAARAHYVL